jgi:hypothetical protein
MALRAEYDFNHLPVAQQIAAYLRRQKTQIGTLLSESADAMNMREYRTGSREIQATSKIARTLARTSSEAG